MKNLSADQVAQKWQTRAGAAAPDYATGIAAVTENPMAKAAAAADLWQQRVQDPSVKAKFQRKLNSASFEAWKAGAAQFGAQRYANGVQNKSAKYAAAIGPVLAYERQLLQTINSMPKATLQDRIQRSNAWINGMAQYKGQG